MQGSVLITGASTGIGLCCAQRMASKGFRVFAGVRKEADAERLARLDGGNIAPVMLDVADEAQVERAAQHVAGSLRGAPLIGLVNNAGITCGGPLEAVSMEEFRAQYDVNVFGAVAMTKALLPQLRASRGRIVNISSVSGLVAFAGFAPYASSKFALEAVTDALRRELHPHGVFACAVQPGAVQSAVWEKGKQQTSVRRSSLTPELATAYGPLVDWLGEIARDIEARAISPERVADLVEHALTSGKPRVRYRVGPNSAIIYALSCLPTRVVDYLAARM